MCGSAPDAPNLPAFPDLTPDENRILNQQQTALGQQQGIVSGATQQVGQNQNTYQQVSGLYNPDGSVNPDALASLRQTQMASQSGQAQAGGSALGYLNSIYAPGGVAQSATNAYQNALNGNVPANQQMAFTQNQNFQALKQQAAQQGIQINGDNWQNAASNSTAGQKLLQNYQQNSNIQNNNYQLGYLQQAGSNMQAIAGTGSTTANTASGLYGNAINQPLGHLGTSVAQATSLTPMLASYQQNLANAYTPYYNQQMGPYQQQMAQAQANYQADLNKYTGFNTMIGSYGTPLASGAGYAGMSGALSKGAAGSGGGGSASTAGYGAAAGGSAAAAGGGSDMAVAGAAA